MATCGLQPKTTSPHWLKSRRGSALRAACALQRPVPAQNSEGLRKVGDLAPPPYHRGHDHDSFHRRFHTRLRRRASLELELIALRHQVSVLRQQRPGRLRLFSTDRLLWVLLYRVWPQVLNAMVLVKPATVPQSRSSDGHRRDRCYRAAITLAESKSSASSARSAANVWITSSSSTSITCAASCRAIFNIITGPARGDRGQRSATSASPSARTAHCNGNHFAPI